MKRIALIGIPGSGKTRLAKALSDEIIRSDGQDCDCNTPVEILDDYAINVRDNGQYAIGLDGGYMANISMAVERYNRERFFHYEVQPKTLIVCGTVLETAIYMSHHFEKSLAMISGEDEGTMEGARLEATVKMLAVLYMDTFHYEQAFYLPSLTPSEDERWRNFERALQASFAAYAAPVAPLLIEEFKDEKDLVKQQVAKVLGRDKS
jgi:hypothetical protein